MFKVIEAIGSIIAIACLIEMASNPKQVARDIQNGPVPSLSKLNKDLTQPKKNAPHKPYPFHRKHKITLEDLE